jgi:pimeloyl-ACP methyl ester carboxylesterase
MFIWLFQCFLVRKMALRIPLRALDGIELHLHKVMQPNNSHVKKKPVLLVPGMFCDHAFFLQRGEGMAHYLAHHYGGSVYVLQRRRVGVFTDIVEKDVVGAVDKVVEDSGCGKVFLGGHSAGAGAVLCAAVTAPSVEKSIAGLHIFTVLVCVLYLHDSIQGLMLLSVPHPKAGGLARRAGIATGLALTHVLGRFPAKALRISNMDEAESIFNPWLLWHWRGKFGRYLNNGVKVRVPLYSAVGKDDFLWAPVQGAKQLHEQVDGGHPLSRFQVFPGTHADIVTDIPKAKTNLW